MKTRLQELIFVTSAACVLCGCSDSTSTKPGGDATEKSATPAVVAPIAEAAKPSVQEVAELTSQFAKFAATQSDKVLGSVGSDLVDKAKSLGQALGANAAVKSQLDTALQSLVAGNDSQALSTGFQLAQAANLTPQQITLAKEVGNLASAFVVQRNFAALDGAQGDVATIVSSLRKGEITPAIPAIQNVAQNANLTAPQKQLIGSLADKYAPGLKKAADSVQQGLQGLKSLPGLKK